MVIIINKYLINNCYETKSLIGAKDYGVIKLAYDHRRKQKVALKSEAADSLHLSHESEVYQALKSLKGFPKRYNYFCEGKRKYLARTLLGPSIYSCNEKIELKTILQIADQLIDRIKTLHALDYIHRDINPNNMAMGTGDLSNTLYLFNFGVAKVFRVNRVHLREQHRVEIVGTADFASLNSHAGLELSRRDDLESMAYTLIYLLKGSLPWQDSADAYYDCFRFKMYCKKIAIPPSNLCQGIEPEFCQFLSYAGNLTCTEEPKYAQVKKLFRDLFYLKGYNLTELDEHTIRNIVKKKRVLKWKTEEDMPNKKKKKEDTIASDPSKKMTRKEKKMLRLLP